MKACVRLETRGWRPVRIKLQAADCELLVGNEQSEHGSHFLGLFFHSAAHAAADAALSGLCAEGTVFCFHFAIFNFLFGCASSRWCPPIYAFIQKSSIKT
ncbi:MAG: hypothetical protein ACTSXZ_08475, partial [Alphaproteobacteria bacterium]